MCGSLNSRLRQAQTPEVTACAWARGALTPSSENARMFVTQHFHGGAIWHKFRPTGSEGSAHCFREPCGFPCFVFPSSGVLATWCLLMEAVGERGRRRAAPWLLCPGHAGVSGSQRQGFRHAHWSFCVASSNGLCTYRYLGQNAASHQAHGTGPLPAVGYSEEKSFPSDRAARSEPWREA